MIPAPFLTKSWTIGLLLENIFGQVFRHENGHVHAVELVERDQVHVIGPHDHSPKLREGLELLVGQRS